MRIILTLFLGTLLLVSCAPSVNSVMNSWTGQHMSALIAAWGEPAQVFKNDEGGVLVYARAGGNAAYDAGDVPTDAYTFQAYDKAASAPVYDPSDVIESEDSRLFWVNAEGYIYLWAQTQK